jgi:hypothetical protein
MKMIQSALKRFPTEILIEKAVEATLRGLESGDPRAEATAVKNVIAMESLNQKDEHKVIDVRVTTRHDELAGIAADLGIEVGVVEDASRQANSGIERTEGEGVEIMERSK